MAIPAQFSPESILRAVRAAAVSPRVRKWGLRLLLAVLVYGMLGFLALPLLSRHPAERQLAAALGRPASIARMRFNPYTLRLELDGIRIGEPAGSGSFVDVGSLVVRVSWWSLFRLAPIVGEVHVDAPQLHIVRTAPQRFNFSDLLERPAAPAKPAARPMLFSVSNIRIDNGSIDFDDRVTSARHRLDQLSLGIPFVANLPSKVEVFVEPKLQARVDGSPFALQAHAKPFSPSHESEVSLSLQHLDLPQLMPYVPEQVPVKLVSGQLSTRLSLRFRTVGQQPQAELSGTVDLDELAVQDQGGQPLLQAHAIHVGAASVEPLRQVYHLSELRIDQPVLALRRDRAGVINLTQLAPAAPAPAPAAAAAPPPAAAAPATVLDFALQQLSLSGGSVSYEDFQAGNPARLDLEQLEIAAANVSTTGDAPATYSVKTVLKQGGKLAVDGGFALKARQLDATAAIEQLELPALQPFVDAVLAARLTHGALQAKSTVKLDWSQAPAAVLVEPAELSVTGLDLVAPAQHSAAVSLARGDVRIGKIDLAARSAEVSAVELDGLAINAQRNAQGSIDLAALVKSAPAPSRRAGPPPASHAPAAKPWRYRIEALAIKRSAVAFTDAAHPEAAVHIAALQLKARDIQSDLSKPWTLDASGTVNANGSFALHGTVAPAPLKLALHLNARQIDIAPFEPYFGAQLNATITRALVSASGDADVAQADGAGDKGLNVRFKGDATLASVRMLDKLSGDSFAGWRTLAISQIQAVYAGGSSDVAVGGITLSNFYARVILDNQGRLNLGRVVGQPEAPAQSLTRSQPAPAVAAPAPPPAADKQAASPLKFKLGGITLHSGRVNYTDNFIKPNFSANVTDLEGQIGAIASQDPQPAKVTVRAQLDANGPVAIDGSINPLAKPAFLDLTATARGVVLTNFSAYAAKYAGYTIERGTLSADLHYKLDHDLLTANNHIFIDQFTFGPRVDSPTATSLPVQFAISLLKNSRGEIDVDLPVSGSLSDPQFSVGGLIWYAFKNLIEKAITSPFSLLAGVFGGSAEELGYVGFAPGSAAIADSEAGKLETLAKALNDRPAVKLDISGRVDPAVDLPALKEAYVLHQVKLQKYRELSKQGATGGVDSVIVAPEEYGKYLERAYGAASIAKPRNFIGLAKTLPPEQMHKLLLDNASVTGSDLQALAQRRSAAVQNWFGGKLPPERIFIVSPKLDAGGIKDQGPTTRADFAVR